MFSTDDEDDEDDSGTICRASVFFAAAVEKEYPLAVAAIAALCQTATATGTWAPVIRLIGDAFATLERLDTLFCQGEVSQFGEADWTDDAEQINAGYGLLLASPEATNALISGFELATRSLTRSSSGVHDLTHLRRFVVLLFHPMLLQPECGRALVLLCLSILALRPEPQAMLQSWLGRLRAVDFRTMVASLQSSILMRILENRDYIRIHEDEAIVSAVKVLALLHAVNRERGLIAPSEFYNEGINDPQVLQLPTEYEHWTEGTAFAFCNYPFLLDSSTKAEVLILESRVQMTRESRLSLMQSLISETHVTPYLILKVRRDHVVEDTLNQLALHPDDLKKQMKVQFVGEDGVDEGGVRKEFFQIIVRSLFDEAFGMFALDDESKSYYFNPASLDESQEFTLCGMILGLAIYNATILDMHFPTVVYKMLCDESPTLEDLCAAKPAVGRSLKYLRDEFTGDFADLAIYFVHEYEAFGSMVRVPLKPGGEAVALTRANLDEYIALIVQHVLVSTVTVQFAAFKAGFLQVCGSRALGLFRPEELELMVCGSTELDFHALEEVTHYEDYTAASPCVRWFWEFVHEMPIELKRKLLAFSTGSDRVPIKGLQSMRFVIMRAGPDSERIVSAQTCFNVLLLPEYSSRDKLRKLLLTAIENFEGFGVA